MGYTICLAHLEQMVPSDGRSSMSKKFLPAHVHILAAIAAGVAILLASGVSYRLASERLGRTSNPGLITTQELSRLPMQIGKWEGRDEPIDKAIAKYTNADALLCRVYSCPGQSVTAYVAGGVRARDMMPHRPEVCYPSAGWTLSRSDAMQVELADGTPLPCRIYVFFHGGFSAKGVAVLNYYIVDGRYGQDVSLLRSQVLRGSSGVQYVAQVQLSVSCSAGGQIEACQKALMEFGSEAAPLIRALMPDAHPAQAPQAAIANYSVPESSAAGQEHQEQP